LERSFIIVPVGEITGAVRSAVGKFELFAVGESRVAPISPAVEFGSECDAIIVGLSF
jgi:hypothetical protein